MGTRVVLGRSGKIRWAEISVGGKPDFICEAEPANHRGLECQFTVLQLPDTVLDGLFGVPDHRRRGRCPFPSELNWLLQVRLALATKRELQPFANVPGIRSLGNELSSEPLDKQKHLFPDGVDKHHVRKIDN